MEKVLYGKPEVGADVVVRFNGSAYVGKVTEVLASTNTEGRPRVLVTFETVPGTIRQMRCTYHGVKVYATHGTRISPYPVGGIKPHTAYIYAPMTVPGSVS